VDAPWTAPKAADWDGQTFETWIRRNTASQAARSLLTLGIEAVFACEPGDISLLHVLFYARSAGSFQRTIDTTGAGTADRFTGGSQLIAERLGRPAAEGTVVLGSPVRRIRYSGGQVTAERRGRLRRPRIIVSARGAGQGRISYDPPLGHTGATSSPSGRRRLGESNARHLYDEPFWRADGLSGQATGDGEGARIVFDTHRPTAPPACCSASLRATRPAASAGQPGRAPPGRPGLVRPVFRAASRDADELCGA